MLAEALGATVVDRRRLLALGTGFGTAVLLPSTANATALPGLPRLDGSLAAGRAEFRAARYSALADRLPALQRAAATAAEQSTGSSRRSASGILARVHSLASELSVKAGDSTAAWTHAQAAVEAAGNSGDPAVLVEATRICATPLRRQGRAEEAVLLLGDTIEQLDAGSARAVPAITAAAGSLALTAAYSAALAGQRATALELIERAEDAVGRLANGPRCRVGDFSDQQVRLYLVGIFHLLGRDAAAVRVTQRIDPRALPTAERRARLGTDTARALLALDSYDAAFAALLSIESAAPEEAGRPSVRALTLELIERRPALADLHAFAARTGAVPA